MGSAMKTLAYVQQPLLTTYLKTLFAGKNTNDILNGAQER